MVTEDFTWNFIQLCTGTISKTGACLTRWAAHRKTKNRKEYTAQQHQRWSVIAVRGCLGEPHEHRLIPARHTPSHAIKIVLC